ELCHEQRCIGGSSELVGAHGCEDRDKGGAGILHGCLSGRTFQRPSAPVEAKECCSEPTRDSSLYETPQRLSFQDCRQSHGFAFRPNCSERDHGHPDGLPSTKV